MSHRRNPSQSLNAARRARELQELAESEVDVLVVGLGVTGAGVALDAASRGLTVAAIDAHDLAFGTSRWSSKLVHGGLRYLAKGDVGIARESAVERGLLMTRIAPHLVRPLPMLLPAAAGVSKSMIHLARAGMAAGDLLRLTAGTPRGVLPKPRRLSAVEARAIVPALEPQGLRGGLLSWDGQLCDDARLVTGLARAAAGHGARIITRCRAVSKTKLRDELTGSSFDVKARVVINATGIWAASLAPSLTLRPSRGSHLVLHKSVLNGLSAGLTVPVPGSTSRYVFALPQHDERVYVGITDDPVDGPLPDVPVAPEQDIDFLLSVLNSVLHRPVRRDEVLGTFAGLRPLLSAPGASADLSRRHAVVSEDGMVTIVGGKLTTYRRMAEHAVNAAVKLAQLPASGCVTKSLALPGAGPSNVDAPARLAARYGSEAPLVAALGTEEVAPGVTTGELQWAVRHEGALDESDLLDRRTRAGLVLADREAALPYARSLFP